MKNLIITDNQSFHHVSPNFSNSADDSPDQTVHRIKVKCHVPLLYTTPSPGLPLTMSNWRGVNPWKKNCWKFWGILVTIVMCMEYTGDGVSDSQKRPPVPLQSFLKRIVPHPVSDTTTDKGGVDKSLKKLNRKLVQGKETDDVHTSHVIMWLWFGGVE